MEPGITEAGRIQTRGHRRTLGTVSTAELPTLSAGSGALGPPSLLLHGEIGGEGVSVSRTPLTLPSDRPDISLDEGRSSNGGQASY